MFGGRFCGIVSYLFGLCLTSLDNELVDVNRFLVVILLPSCQLVPDYFLMVNLMFPLDLLMSYSVYSFVPHNSEFVPAVQDSVLVWFVY